MVVKDKSNSLLAHMNGQDVFLSLPWRPGLYGIGIDGRCGGFSKTLKFYIKVFLCDGQVTVRRAILYTDSSCETSYFSIERYIVLHLNLRTVYNFLFIITPLFMIKKRF